MSRKRLRRNQKRLQRKNAAARRQHVRSIPGGSDGDEYEDQPLIADIRDTLDHSDPFALLMYTSGLLNLTDPSQPQSVRAPARRAPVDRENLLESFVEIDAPETTAALTAIATLIDDELLATRIRKEVASRRHVFPPWVGRRLDIELLETLVMTDVLGDGDDYFIEFRLGTGPTYTALAYVDHNIGTIVKDAFVIEASVETVRGAVSKAATDSDAVLSEIDPADARRRITDAIDHGVRTYPPAESDTWPNTRPFLEWVLRSLPEGGRPYDVEEWSDRQVQELGGTSSHRRSRPASAAPPGTICSSR